MTIDPPKENRAIFSHDFSLLVDALAQDLLMRSQTVEGWLQKKWICVPHNSMQQWLSIELAKRGCFSGYKILLLEERLFSRPYPSSLELTLLLYDALRDLAIPSTIPRCELALHLAPLFLAYGIYLPPQEWIGQEDNWQKALLRRLFLEGTWRLPIQDLPHSLEISHDPIYCFGFDALPEIYWQSLARFPIVHWYLFSPCLHFWEDTCSDKERGALLKFWKKRGTSTQAREMFDQSARQAPPLLANWGGLGRKTLESLDRVAVETEILETTLQEPKTLLEAIRHQILFFEERPPPFPIDNSIAIFLTGASRAREVECLCKEILHVTCKKGVTFAEIAVLTPDLDPYLPWIEWEFAQHAIPYRISASDKSFQSPFFIGFRKLITLNDLRADVLIDLIETPAIYRKQGWKVEEVQQLSVWLREICQGDDWRERGKRLLERSLCLFPHSCGNRISSCNTLELLEQLFEFLEKLQNLTAMAQKELPVTEWAQHGRYLCEHYLFLEKELDWTALQILKERFFQLECCDAIKPIITHMEEEKTSSRLHCPLSLLAPFLLAPIMSSSHASHLHAVRIETLQTGAWRPVRALFLLGMDEEKFPRKPLSSSLNLLHKGIMPEAPEIDRYLMLQALFAAQEYLRISYGHISREEGKPISASLLVQQLLDTIGPTSSALCHIYRRAPPSEPSPPTPLYTLSCTQAPADDSAMSVASSSTSEITLRLFVLNSFARHPWKFFLQRREGIFWKDSRSQRPLPLTRALWLRTHLRATLTFCDSALRSQTQLHHPSVEIPGRSIGEAPPLNPISCMSEKWDEYIQEIPSDLFQGGFKIDLQRRLLRWQAQCKQWEVAIVPLFLLESIPFDREIASMNAHMGNERLTEDNRPNHHQDLSISAPLTFSIEGNQRILIVGEIQDALSQGALHWGDDSMASLMKRWPEILATCIARKSDRIYCIKSGKIKTIRDPVQAMHRFLSYYLQRSSLLSLLMPEWTEALLVKNPLLVKEGGLSPADFFRMCETSGKNQNETEDPVIPWMLTRIEWPTRESLLQEIDWLREVFADLIALYRA